MTWHDLFTYSFISLPFTSSCPCQTVPRKVADITGLGGNRHTALWNTRCQKQSFQSTLMTPPPHTLFSIDHFALSSINLQNALFKLLINTLIDLQKCHCEAKAIDSHEPQAPQIPTVTNDEYMNECVHYSPPGKGSLGFLGGYGAQVNEQGVE